MTSRDTTKRREGRAEARSSNRSHVHGDHRKVVADLRILRNKDMVVCLVDITVATRLEDRARHVYGKHVKSRLAPRVRKAARPNIKHRQHTYTTLAAARLRVFLSTASLDVAEVRAAPERGDPGAFGNGAQKPTHVPPAPWQITGPRSWPGAKNMARAMATMAMTMARADGKQHAPCHGHVQQHG